MITNNDIREFLGLPKSDKEFNIYQVDGLDINRSTLMFINKPGVDLVPLDDSENCLFLVDKRYYSDITNFHNDFICISNPKFRFCEIVYHYHMPSKFQTKCYRNVLGTGTKIDPGVILGGDDFSPVMGDSRNELLQFPQMGGYMIGDDVVIKYNTMIGKGTFGYTKIGDNTMIDFGCQIGHNCEIGRACIIAAGTIIGGSTTIGDYTTIGIGAKIRNGIHIGKNVSVGMGAVVIKDVPDNCVVVGNPARIIEHKSIFDEGGLV